MNAIIIIALSVLDGWMSPAVFFFPEFRTFPLCFSSPLLFPSRLLSIRFLRVPLLSFWLAGWIVIRALTG